MKMTPKIPTPIAQQAVSLDSRAHRADEDAIRNAAMFPVAAFLHLSAFDTPGTPVALNDAR
jgi:hypothetical protein